MFKVLVVSTCILLLIGCSSTSGAGLGRPALPKMSDVPGRLTPGTQCAAEEEGQMRVGYFQPYTTGDVACSTGIQSCVHGEWTGPIMYAECRSDTRSCDGQPHGSTKTGYLTPNSHAGQPCPEGIATCLNGEWVGPTLYESCTEY